MAINCLSPISPSTFIRRWVWDEVVTEANTIKASVCTTGITSPMLLHSYLSTSYSCIPFLITKGEKGLLTIIAIHYHLI